MTELARPITVTMPAISKHLRVLERAGLVIRQRMTAAVVPARAGAAGARDQSLEQYRQFFEGSDDRLTGYLLGTCRNLAGSPAACGRASPATVEGPPSPSAMISGSRPASARMHRSVEFPRFDRHGVVWSRLVSVEIFSYSAGER